MNEPAPAKPFGDLKACIDMPDEQSCVLYLEVPAARVVLLQAYFDLYEGLGVVRTLDVRTSLVCILTTKSLLPDCCAALEAIWAETEWKPAALPTLKEREHYIGCFSNASDCPQV